MCALAFAPPGTGAGWTAKREPFQRSANACPPARPTAVHDVAAGQETLESAALPAAGGTGVGWTLQLDPFQRSASGTTPALPTAVQADADVHEMLESSAPAGAGEDSSVHAVPSQRSIKARLTPPTGA